MRGLNNEQLAVMSKIGPPGAPPQGRATWREFNVILKLIDRGLAYNEPSERGNIVRFTKIGRLIYDALTSERTVKRMGL